MANIYAPDYNQKPLHMSEYGNAWAEDYSITAQPTKNDVMLLGIIPAGVRVQTVILKNGAAGSSATVSLGFLPFEGDTPTADDDYWITSGDVENAGSIQSVAPAITFDRPVKLVMTATGANWAAKSHEVVVTGMVVGAP